MKKTKSFVFAWILMTGTVGFAAPKEPGICSKTLETVCSGSEVQRHQSVKLLNLLKEQVAEEALEIAIPKIELLEKSISKDSEKEELILKTINQEIMGVAKKKFARLESTIVTPQTVSLIKGYMVQAIDESSFSAAAKAYFKQTIQEVVVGNFSDYLNKTGIEKLNEVLSEDDERNLCGPDGLIDNAFATDVGGQKYVLLCPGLLLSLEQTTNAQERLKSIIQILSHEISHHIDARRVGTTPYVPYLTCMATHYGDKLKTHAKDEEFCKENADTALLCEGKRVISHSGELIADAWGIKVLNIHARKQNLSSLGVSDLISKSLVTTCGKTDDGVHPSAGFRIETLIKMDSEMSQNLGCSKATPPSKPTCSF